MKNKLLPNMHKKGNYIMGTDPSGLDDKFGYAVIVLIERYGTVDYIVHESRHMTENDFNKKVSELKSKYKI